MNDKEVFLSYDELPHNLLSEIKECFGRNCEILISNETPNGNWKSFKASSYNVIEENKITRIPYALTNYELKEQLVNLIENYTIYIDFTHRNMPIVKKISRYVVSSPKN